MNFTKMVLVATCFVLGAAGPNYTKDQKNVNDNVSLGRRVFQEIYGEGRVDLVDQLYADEFVDDSPGGGKGRDLIKEAVTGFHKAFPDLRIEIEDAFGIGDKVVLRYTARGTQREPTMTFRPRGRR